MKKKIAMLLSLLMLLVMMPFAAQAEESQTVETLPTLELHQINMGCANGYLIRFADQVVLIDGGEAWPTKPDNIFMNYLETIGIDHVDVYIITHWHLDHCMHLNDVLTRWGDENTVVYGASEVVNPDYDPLANGAEYRWMKDGDEFTIGGSLRVNCVGPEAPRNKGNANMDSLNFLLTYGEKKVLFTGDYAASGNINRNHKELCRYIDVLQFPHHGIKDDNNGNYEIGVAVTKVLTPNYVLVPGTAPVWDIWNFVAGYSETPRLTRPHIYTNRHGNVLMLTDGQEIEFRTEVDPAQYVQYVADREIVPN